jgi:hypothetical protein
MAARATSNVERPTLNVEVGGRTLGDFGFRFGVGRQGAALPQIEGDR